VLVLVTGATGAQGGATARRLLQRGHAVRVLTRRADSPHAHELIRLGATLAVGDLDDPEVLGAATRDVNGVFSVQVPDTTDTDSERRHGFALIKAAARSGITHFVHTSVSCAGRHESFPRWAEGYWSRKYWTDKWDVEQAVRTAGFRHWTVLRPSFLMDNFAHPKAGFMFPHLAGGEIATALRSSTRMQLIAADDVGAFARAAFEEPLNYHGRNIELAAEALTMPEVADILSRVTGRPIVNVELTPAQAIARGLFPGWVRSQEWSNEVGYCASTRDLMLYGIALTSFEQWARCHRDAIHVGERSVE
jgi:uncharacterized protein YbjT (DUF2867 family)